MAHKTDLRRKARTLRLDLQRALRPIDVSVGFSEWAGTWQGDAAETGKTPPHLALIGGLWDPVGCKFVGRPDRPAVTLTVQEQQTAALASRAQFLAVFGGQRSGKTYVGREIALCTLVGQPGSIVFYLLPRFGKSGFVLDGLMDTLDGQGWIRRRDEKKHRYELVNGSVLQVFSAADKRSEETFLGGECDVAVLEEFREMPDRVFAKLFSRVISRNGRMAIVSSPEAGHMIEEIDRGEWKGKVAFEVHRLDVRHNFFIFPDRPSVDEHGAPQHAIIEQARLLYDPRRYARDVLGQNVAETGADYYNWIPEIHVVDEPPGRNATEWLWSSEDLWLCKDTRWRGMGSIGPTRGMTQTKLVGMDLGAAMMTAIEAILVCHSEGMSEAQAMMLGVRPGWRLTYSNTSLVVLHEHCKENTSVLDFVPNVMERAGLTPDRAAIFCDPSGQARDHVMGQSPVDLLRSRFGYHVFCKPCGNLRQPGIDAIRMRLQMRRISVMSRCKGLIADMGKVRSIGKASKEVSRDPNGHRPDALRYLIDNLFPVRDVFADESAFNYAVESHRMQ